MWRSFDACTVGFLGLVDGGTVWRSLEAATVGYLVVGFAAGFAAGLTTGLGAVDVVVDRVDVRLTDAAPSVGDSDEPDPVVLAGGFETMPPGCVVVAVTPPFDALETPPLDALAPPPPPPPDEPPVPGADRPSALALAFNA